MWNLSGPIAAESPFPAHLDFMYYLDRFLFFGHDPVRLVQLHLASSGVRPLDVATSVVYNMHLAEPYVAGYFLWRLRRPLYLQFAASALILLVLGFMTFIAFPAVPPWMAAERLVYLHGTYFSTGWQDLASLKQLGYLHPFHFVTTHGRVYLPGVVNRFGIVLRSHPLPFHGTPLFYVFQFRGDPIAAMPSEHAAFPMLELLAFAGLGRRYAAGFSCWVLAVLFSVVYLGEHWVTDVLAGWLYAILIVLFIRWYVSRPVGTALAKGNAD
jgi:membrane-associated phospholipid phosphatase